MRNSCIARLAVDRRGVPPMVKHYDVIPHERHMPPVGKLSGSKVKRISMMAAAGVGALVGKLALITGAGSGIGRSVCQVLAREGAKIAAVDVNKDGLSETLDMLEGEHRSYATDISIPTSVSSLLSEVKENFSGEVPTIAVNCAGITRDTLFLKMSEAEYDQVMDVNLKGTFLVTQAVSREMVKQKISEGSIVNISSISGKVGNLGQANYSASKAGVIGFTRTIAKELGRFGIRCNAVLPGFIQTPMVETVPEKVMEALKGQIPLGKLGNPTDIAETCLFLASNKSSYITGASIEVTGGLFIG